MILAAGYSSRMGQVKPLLKPGKGNMLEKTTQSLLNAGTVHIVYNARFDKGMFPSVQAGVQAISARHAYVIDVDTADMYCSLKERLASSD